MHLLGHPDLIRKPDAACQPGEGGVAIFSHFGNCFYLYIAMMTLASLGSQCHTVEMVSFSSLKSVLFSSSCLYTGDSTPSSSYLNEAFCFCFWFGVLVSSYSFSLNVLDIDYGPNALISFLGILSPLAY